MTSFSQEAPLDIPKNPVFGWAAFRGNEAVRAPCVLDLPGLTFTTSGRASIALALKSLGVASGDWVLAPSYHCPSMISPIAAAGAKPAFFAITETGAVDYRALESMALELRPRAIIAAHYFGLPQPMAALRRWCDDHDVALIEDCAHCLFGVSDGKPVGSWGDLSIVSLTKFLPLPEGGAIRSNGSIRISEPLQPRGKIANVRLLADMLEMGAKYGQFGLLTRLFSAAFQMKNWLRHPNRPTRKDDDVDTVAEGPPAAYLTLDTSKVNLRMSSIGAWFARSLPRGRMIEMRRRNYLRLASNLSGNRGRFRPLFPDLPALSAPYVFPLWVEEPEAAYRQLRQHELPLFRWDWLWPDAPVIAGDSGALWSRHVFQIGCHQSLTEKDIDAISEALIRYII